MSVEPGRPAALGVGRSVVHDVVRLAAADVAGVVRVGRGGPAWWRSLRRDPVAVRVHDGRVDVRLRIAARPGESLPALAAGVRAAAAGAIERLLGLETGEVTVLIDAVESPTGWTGRRSGGGVGPR